jgi:cupin fold WbuC family metalloprotein
MVDAESSKHAINENDNLIVVKPSKKYLAGSLTGLEGNRDVKVISSSVFDDMISEATNHPRKRKMIDFTKDPSTNTMQTLMNTWIEGSYSPVHKHQRYSEIFFVLQGALAFFTFDDEGGVTCNVLSSNGVVGNEKGRDAAIIVEKNTWHAMTAAPTSLGWPGHAVIFENSGHSYEPNNPSPTKIQAPWALSADDGLNGDPAYFHKIMQFCPKNN